MGTPRLPPEREAKFPDLLKTGYAVTSPEDYQYNCIAWAAGEENKLDCWNPFCIGNGYFWPPNLERKADVATLIKLYEMVGGYLPCNTGELEPGFEKIVLYVGTDGDVTHASRQKPDGSWTSKLGDWEDISHDSPAGLCSPVYGKIGKYLKRPLKR